MGRVCRGIVYRGMELCRGFLQRHYADSLGEGEASKSLKQRSVSPVAFFHFSSKQENSLFRFVKKQTNLD